MHTLRSTQPSAFPLVGASHSADSPVAWDEPRGLSLADWQYLLFIGFSVLAYAVGTWTIGVWIFRLITSRL